MATQQFIIDPSARRIRRDEPRVCFWNYCDGDCVFQTQSLIASLRFHGVNNDFICFSPVSVKGATKRIYHKLDVSIDRGCLFKLHLLPRLVSEVDYDYFAWIDSDNLCVKPFARDLSSLCYHSPIHTFVETDLSTVPNGSWYYFNNLRLVELFHSKGVIGPVHNCNGGLWIIKRTFIPTFYNLAMRFWNECKDAGMVFVDEVVLSYATHLLSDNIESHKTSNLHDVWFTDWTDTSGKLPAVDKQYELVDWFTGQRSKMWPSVVHLLGNKKALTEAGKLI